MSEILKSRLEMVRLAKQWKHWSKKIATAAHKILGECEVYIFGSIIEGKATGGSDVDILIVSDKLPQTNKDRWEIRARIEEEAGLPLYHPYEIHLANTKEAQWYFKHIKKYIKISPEQDDGQDSSSA